jgi:acetyl esterase/lipase
MTDSEFSRRGLLAGMAALLGGCSATGALNALVPANSYRGRVGVAYGSDPRQRLDTYLPLEPAGAFALVVFFYGGHWSRGSRADYRFVGEALASSGIGVVVADYRLSPQVGWREILQDCAAAAQWAAANARELGADPARLLLMGHSAGAYNAAMLALDPRWLGRPARELFAGWVGLAGPYDFLPIGDPDTQRAFGWPATPRDSQPIEHVSRDDPPALLIAAANDTVVSTQRSTIGLARRLRDAGVPVQVKLYELNHATVVGALAAPLRFLAPVREDVVGFVRAASNGRA